MDRFSSTIERLILSRIRTKRVLRYALFMFLSLLAQTMVLNRFRILGVCPMVLPAVAVAVGMFEGATWGSIFSLVMGIFADMAFVENTVTFTVLFPALAALLATGLVQMLRTAAMDVFSLSMIPTVLLQTLWSLPFAVLAYLPPARWIE